MLPNFIVIGAAKCGTTSICELLGSHPDVFMCDPKEPCFFSHMDDMSRTREWYESLFSSVETELAIGEGSTAYTHPDVIEVTASRIKETIPECRLIYMVRHPLRRLESDWRMRRHEGWTPASISEAVMEQRSLVTHGLYWTNLSVYRRFFDDEQLLIVFLEDMTADPEAELARCFSHIGVNAAFSAPDAARPRNSAAGFRSDSQLAAAARSWSHFEAFKNALPDWVVQGAKKLLTRRREFRVDWLPEVRAKVLDELRPDAARFLEHCGKPRDFWTL